MSTLSGIDQNRFREVITTHDHLRESYVGKLVGATALARFREESSIEAGAITSLSEEELDLYEPLLSESPLESKVHAAETDFYQRVKEKFGQIGSYAFGNYQIIQPGYFRLMLIEAGSTLPTHSNPQQWDATELTATLQENDLTLSKKGKTLITTDVELLGAQGLHHGFAVSRYEVTPEDRDTMAQAIQRLAEINTEL